MRSDPKLPDWLIVGSGRMLAPPIGASAIPEFPMAAGLSPGRLTGEARGPVDRRHLLAVGGAGGGSGDRLVDCGREGEGQFVRFIKGLAGGTSQADALRDVYGTDLRGAATAFLTRAAKSSGKTNQLTESGRSNGRCHHSGRRSDRLVDRRGTGRSRGSPSPSIEQGDFGREASWAGAGILPPGNLDAARTPEAQLRSLSHSLWSDWAESLEAETGIDTGYSRCGGLEFRLGTDGDELADEIRTWRNEEVRVEELRRKRPGRSSRDSLPNRRPSTVCPNWDRCGIRGCSRRCIAACAERGVRMLPGMPVIGFDEREGEIAALRTPSGLLSCRALLRGGGRMVADDSQSLGDSHRRATGARPDRVGLAGSAALLSRAAVRSPISRAAGRRAHPDRSDRRTRRVLEIEHGVGRE